MIMTAYNTDLIKVRPRLIITILVQITTFMLSDNFAAINSLLHQELRFVTSRVALCNFFNLFKR